MYSGRAGFNDFFAKRADGGSVGEVIMLIQLNSVANEAYGSFSQLYAELCSFIQLKVNQSWFQQLNFNLITSIK